MRQLTKSEAKALSVDELVAIAIERIEIPDPENEFLNLASRALVELMERADLKTFAACERLCHSPTPSVRCVGATILGQLGPPHLHTSRFLLEERYQALSSLLEREISGSADPEVLSVVCYALGWVHDPKAIPLVLRLLRHSATEVRGGVRHALTGYEDETAILGLIELSQDSEAVIRDWATWGLSQEISTDTAEIREALLKRLHDEDIGAREEAIFGLARRKDERVLPFLIKALIEDEWAHDTLLLDAAAHLADSKLCDALVQIKEKSSHGGAQTEWQVAATACGCAEDSDLAI